MDLEDILNGQEPAETAVAEEPEAEEAPEQVEAQPGQPRDEHGRFAPKGENPAPAQTEPQQAAPPAAESHQIPPAALAEERRKRQELEARVAEYERHLQSLQQQPQQPPHIPSVYEDENGFADGLMQTAVLQARQQLLPEVQQQIATMRVEIAREMMRGAHPDFDEVEKVYLELSQTNPALRQWVGQQPNPVRAAYEYAKKHQEVQKLGSLDIEAIKQAAVQEYLAQNAPAPAPQQIPTSLADSQSARGSSAGAWAPPSLDDILGRK
jgi:hypothetical protein